MGNIAFIALVQNAALLLTLIVIFDLVMSRRQVGGSLPSRLLAGLAIGAISIALVWASFHLETGIVFDTRSVLLSVSGLFFGATPTLVAMGMAAAFRIWQGGPGAWTGTLVILATGGIGIGWRRYRRGHLKDITAHELYAFGMIAHLVMLALMLTLPWETAQRVLAGIGLPVILIYPATTTALGIILAQRLRREAAVTALAESEATARALLNAPTDVVVLLDTEGTLLDANETMARRFRRSREELIGICAWDLFAPEVAEMRKRHIAEVIRKGQPVRFEDQRAGHWLDNVIYPIRDAAGHVTRVAVIARDITEQKRAQADLRKSQNLLKSTQQLAHVGGWEWDVAQQTMTWTDETYRIHGMTPDHPDPGSPDHIERSLVCYDPADRPVIETAFRRCAEEGRPYDLELPLTRIDGRRIWVRTTAHALKEEGRVKKIIGNIVDITDRKQAEEERGRLMTQIRRQAQQMEQVLSTVPVGVLQFDAKGRVLHANPVGAQDLDMLADAHVGQTLTHLGDRPLAELLTSPPAGGLWHEVKAAGHVFEVLARPVENGAEAKQWVMVLNDVTQELETRTQLAQQERLAAVGQLAAGIAHDLNNNLAVIALYTQMALREPVMPPKTHERLSTVSQQVKRMAALIQQILDFSRRAMLERQPLNLVPFMKEIVKLLERTIPEHIEVRLTASRNSEDLIAYADPTRMQQIVMNLAVNARDAMPEGGRLDIELERVTVERGRSPLRPKMAPGDWIKLAVSDNGSGIPLEVMPHIFEPFYTTKGPGEGTGLGLAQVYGIVEQHGGRIDVTTEIDQGTTFTIYLPALGVQPFEPTSEKSAALWQGHGEVVLVVEDDPTLRAALVAGLEQLNYRTLQVGNGEHALALLAQPDQDIALVLSDVVMPGIGRHSSLPSIAGERAPRAGHPPHRPRHGRGDRVAQRTRLGGLVNQTAAARAVGAGDRAGAPPGAKWLTGSYVGVVRITLNKPLTHR